MLSITTKDWEFANSMECSRHSWFECCRSCCHN